MLWQLANSKIIGVGAEKRRSEDQRAERTGHSSEWLTLRLKDSERGSWFSPVLLYLPARLLATSGVRCLCCEEELLPKHHAKAGRISLFKAIPTMQLSPAIRKEMRKVISRQTKKPVVLAGNRSTTTGCGATDPKRSSAQLTGKRKANELASSGGSLEPVNRRPAPRDGSVPLSERASTVTGKHAASCSRQLVSPERGDVRVCPGRVRRPASAKCVAQAHSHGFRPVSICCLIRVNRRKSSDMSAPLRDKPHGTITSAHVTNPAYQQGSFITRPRFLFQVYVTPMLSWLGCRRLALAV